MNKKNLSVVMAGAMLATSVAPVLAATESSVSIDNKLLLASNIETKMKSKEISSNEDIKKVSNGYVSTEVSNLMTAGKSAYGVKVIGTNGEVKKINNFETSYNIAQVKTFLTGDDLVVGDKIEVYEKATTNFYGEVIPGTEIKQKEEVKITNFDQYIEELNKSPFVKSAKKNKDGVTAKVLLHSLEDINDTTSNVELTVTAGGTMLDLKLPLDAEGNVTTDPMECVNFANKYTYTPSNKVTDEPTLVETIKITSDMKDHTEYYKVSDLYDGIAYTSDGTSIIDMMNDDNYSYKFYKEDGESIITSDSDIIVNQDTKVASFIIKFTRVKNGAEVGSPVREIKVSSTNLDELKNFYNLLKTGEYKVGVVAGDNRYETAVNVAKAQVATGNMFTSNANKGKLEIGAQKSESNENNIVIVNGTSLVDGLAAAPYAAKANKINTVKNDASKGSNHAAPVLLSEADKLPTATKEYINEISSELSFNEKKNVTVTLIGGESVLNESLEKEIKDMGFTVKRLGGDNREETSLEVAEAMNVKDKAFVVGGNGEADAMSIAAVASNTSKETPIIVSSVHGLTKDAVKFIEKDMKDAAVTIVGGESVVSKDEEAKIDAVVNKEVTRVAGANRFETNAKIIEKYYANPKASSVVAVKDGINNPSELVDALSAANYAAGINAPVVLASKEVKDVQKNALLKSTNTAVNKVVQVGNGAERSVLVTLADMFGVKNI